MTARDLLLGLLLLALPWLAERALAPPAPLGPPVPAADCRVPVEVRGDGIGCLDPALADRLRLGAGDLLDGTQRRRMAPERLAAWSAPVDLNRGSRAELASLDGIGDKLAERIVRARPFATIDALLEVRGIGARKLERMRPRLVVSKMLDDKP